MKWHQDTFHWKEVRWFFFISWPLFSKIYVATVFPLFRNFLLQSKKKVQWHVGRAQRRKSLFSSGCPQFEFFQRPSDAFLAPFPQMSKYYIVRKNKMAPVMGKHFYNKKAPITKCSFSATYKEVTTLIDPPSPTIKAPKMAVSFSLVEMILIRDLCTNKNFEVTSSHKKSSNWVENIF